MKQRCNNTANMFNNNIKDMSTFYYIFSVVGLVHWMRESAQIKLPFYTHARTASFFYFDSFFFFIYYFIAIIINK